MFNHKNTPSSFLRKNNVDRPSSLPKISEGSSSKDVGGEIESSSLASSCSVEDEEGVRGYQCVSVSTRWSWDDIFTTVNTTQAEGNYCSIQSGVRSQITSNKNCTVSRSPNCYVM